MWKTVELFQSYGRLAPQVSFVNIEEIIYGLNVKSLLNFVLFLKLIYQLN